MADWAIPRPRAAATVAPNDVSRPARAAARAGTTSRVVVAGSRAVNGPTRMPPRPASTLASIQLAADTTSGDQPSMASAVWSSAVARLASPNRVKRESAHSPTAAATTNPARSSRSRGTSTPSTVTARLGRSDGTGRLSAPNQSTASAWSVASSPTDATTRARAGAVRSGRKTSTCTTSPSPAAATTLTASAGHSPRSGRSSTKA